MQSSSHDILSDGRMEMKKTIAHKLHNRKECIKNAIVKASMRFSLYSIWDK